MTQPTWGPDLNNDGAAGTDYVPETTESVRNPETEQMLTAVNASRAANGRAPISADQIDTNEVNQLDVRASKSVALGANRRIEVIAQVFNLRPVAPALMPFRPPLIAAKLPR